MFLSTHSHTHTYRYNMHYIEYAGGSSALLPSITTNMVTGSIVLDFSLSLYPSALSVLCPMLQKLQAAKETADRE